MSIDIIRERLTHYHCITPLEEELALNEITQEAILMSLSRQNFFSVAEFHGGTALRILYGLRRFSEDLDFALLQPNAHFLLSSYLHGIAQELRAFGYEFEVHDRDKADSVVKKAFLKDDSLGKVLLLQRNKNHKKIKIKLEVDTNPPLGATTELKYLDFPFPFGILAKDLPSAFAGKLHALLCRSYVKGRDWYDFIWYVSRHISINLVLLENALKQQGPWKLQPISINLPWVLRALHEKIDAIDWTNAIDDIKPFITSNEQPSLSIWGKAFFHAEVDKLLKTTA